MFYGSHGCRAIWVMSSLFLSCLSIVPVSLAEEPTELILDAAERNRRLARTPLETARLLAQVYGHELPRVEYIPALALVGRLQLGDLTGEEFHLQDVTDIVTPYFNGEEDASPKSGSALSGHLIFSELAKRSEGERRARYLELAQGAADRAFDEDGNQLPSMPFHLEMSDSVFMGGPILAQVGGLTRDPRYFAACQTHLNFMQSLVLREDGLYRHSPLCEAAWGRGNGFPALGMAFCLAEFPEDHPYRPKLLASFQAHMKALIPHQGEDGSWHQVIDHPESYPELSCTSMIALAMAWGIREQWLDRREFEPVVRRAWEAIAVRIANDGSLSGVCTGTGKQKTLQDYFERPAIFGHDARGGAMALLLCVELSRMPEKSIEPDYASEVPRIPSKSP
jgi:unsaturated rhamnogalacturonyl hydrolase